MKPACISAVKFLMDYEKNVSFHRMQNLQIYDVNLGSTWSALGSQLELQKGPLNSNNKP